jgi:hypothetical protein
MRPASSGFSGISQARKSTAQRWMYRYSRDFRQDIVNGVEDESPAFGKDFAAFENMQAHLAEDLRIDSRFFTKLALWMGFLFTAFGWKRGAPRFAIPAYFCCG